MIGYRIDHTKNKAAFRVRSKLPAALKASVLPLLLFDAGRCLPFYRRGTSNRGSGRKLT